MQLKTITGKSAGTKSESKKLKPGTEELGADTDDPIVAASGFSFSAIQDEISQVETLIQSVKGMSEDLLLNQIKAVSKGVGDFVQEAKRTSIQALLNVWFGHSQWERRAAKQRNNNTPIL